ncbi:hypothetical protein SAMN05192563_102471 [Paraburkholderia aspalathi]|uniref:Uncharacterized protein n=1 Tax=Paraburkholderia aspalathi TaxID=1324617 RepID=A0A1I7EJ93_9BURK|nr:hypothetical protein SAMN05192563_102471 [Paraburkholderia aspalathi]
MKWIVRSISVIASVALLAVGATGCRQNDNGTAGASPTGASNATVGPTAGIGPASGSLSTASGANQ